VRDVIEMHILSIVKRLQLLYCVCFAACRNRVLG